MDKKVELLAPAGDIKSFYAACNSGADAIYMGVDKFNARVMAKNFSQEEYIDCIKYAHRLGIKVFLTLNILLSDDEIKEALNLILELYKSGLDAVILQDLGLAKKIHEIFPKLDMHASTQLSVYSLNQVNFLKRIGFKRVVLARELTLEEIKNICKNTDLEIEVFVHGALCVSVSGQCLMSSMIGNRSANRGNCAQPCRMKYTLVNKTLNKEVAHNKYLLSKKDIFGIDYIDDLINAGVYSLKIEGRNRSAEYVALAVNKYKKAICKDSIDEEDKKELRQIFIRENASSGYLNGVEYRSSITNLTPKNTGLFLGIVEDQKGPYIKIKLNEKVNLHDGFEIYDVKNSETLYSSIVTCIKDNKNNIVNKDNSADIGEYVWIGDVNKKIKFGSAVYKTSSFSLNEKYSNFKNVKPKFDVFINIKMNKKIEAVSVVNNEKVLTNIEYIPEIAQKVSVSVNNIILNFSKTNDEKIDFNSINVSCQEGLFVPVSQINLLRRTHVLNILKCLNNTLSLLNKGDIENIRRKIDKLDEEFEEKSVFFDYKSIFIYRFDINKKHDFLNYDIVYITIQDMMRYKDKILEIFKNIKTKLFVAIPNFVLKNVTKYINDNLENLILSGVSGILLGSFHFYDLCIKLKEKYGILLVGDYSFNISNKYCASLFKKLKFDVITPSLELSEDRINEINKIVNVEMVNGYVTVMTSRYCIIGSFEQNRKTYIDKCKKPCLNNNFILIDTYGTEYKLVTDPYDCIMRIVRKRNVKFNNNDKNIRESIIE